MSPEQEEALRKAEERERVLQEAQRRALAEGAKDIGLSGGRGLLEGAVGLAGTGSDITSLAVSGASGLTDKVRGLLGMPEMSDEQREAQQNMMYQVLPLGRMFQAAPGSADYVRAFDEATEGQFKYEPQTTAGEYARTVGQFLPGAAIPGGGASLGTRALTAVGGGLASEFAGQLTEGTDYEVWARVAGALAGGAATGMATRPRLAERLLAKELPNELSRADVEAATNLMRDAQARGMEVSLPQALSQVTNGRFDLGRVWRRVRESTSGSQRVRDIGSRRNAQVRQATEDFMPAMGRETPDAVRTGSQVQTANRNAMTRLNRQVNAMTDPLYRAAERTPIDPSEFARLQRMPWFQRALQHVRNDPSIEEMQRVGRLGDDQIGVLNQVKIWLQSEAESGSISQTERAALRRTANAVRDAATNVSPEYRRALEIQSRVRQNIIGPVTDGPTGQMASTNRLERQGRMATGSKTPGSARNTYQSMRRLFREDPDAALQLARSRIQTLVDNALQENSNAGYRLHRNLRGDPQTTRNIESMLRALPGGRTRVAALRRFLDVMEAVGTDVMADQSVKYAPGLTSAMTRSQLSVRSQAMGMISDWLSKRAYNRVGAEIADILMDPNNEELILRLANSRSVEDAANFLARMIEPATVDERVVEPNSDPGAARAGLGGIAPMLPYNPPMQKVASSEPQRMGMLLSGR